MHRGRDANGRSVEKPSVAHQECRAPGWRVRGNWNLFRRRGKNSTESTGVAEGKQGGILIIRRQCPNEEEARLDQVVADSVIGFVSNLPQVPKGLGIRGIRRTLAKPNDQGGANALLSDELQRNDTRSSVKVESGSSCRISRGPALSHSSEWPGRYKLIQAQDLVGNRVNFPLQQVDEFGESRVWGQGNDINQLQPNGWWRRRFLGALAGAVGIRIMSLKYPWLLLSELFSLPCFRLNQNLEESEGRRHWWNLPVKVATAISSRFCSSISNSFIAANLLLLIFELRGMGNMERLAHSGLPALKNSTHVGCKCSRCLGCCNQDVTGVEHPSLQIRSKTGNGVLDQSLISSTHLELKEGEHSYVQLPLNLREDSTRILVLPRKGCELKDILKCKEDIVHLAELIHVALSMPKHSRGELSQSELQSLTPQSAVRNFSGQVDPQVFISFVSNDTSEEIQLVFPQHTSVERHPRASENSAILKSILMDKCKNGLIKSSVCASDAGSESFFEACAMSLPDLEHPGCEQTQELESSSEGWRSSYSDASSVDGFDQSYQAETVGQCCQNSSGLDISSDRGALVHSDEESLTDNRPDTDPNAHPPPVGSTPECDEQIISPVLASAPLHFADHPACVSLRERRHSYKDQNYLTAEELNTPSWRELVFWHGHCREGNPTLYILLGRAVQQLPAGELQTISAVIISQMEYAEVNFFNGSAKQMNIVMDLWGIGLMRMPPLEILSRVGMIMNRDYAGRGHSVILVNAPVMLSLVIGAIKRVILRPAYNKGAQIEKGFLETKDRILFFNRNYKHALEKHFDLTLLPSMFGGECNSKFCPQDCDLGGKFLLRR